MTQGFVSLLNWFAPQRRIPHRNLCEILVDSLGGFFSESLKSRVGYNWVGLEGYLLVVSTSWYRPFDSTSSWFSGSPQWEIWKNHQQYHPQQHETPLSWAITTVPSIPTSGFSFQRQHNRFFLWKLRINDDQRRCFSLPKSICYIFGSFGTFFLHIPNSSPPSPQTLKPWKNFIPPNILGFLQPTHWNFQPTKKNPPIQRRSCAPLLLFVMPGSNGSIKVPSFESPSEGGDPGGVHPGRSIQGPGGGWDVVFF